VVGIALHSQHITPLLPSADVVAQDSGTVTQLGGVLGVEQRGEGRQVA
jgi:hypothetical protein